VLLDQYLGGRASADIAVLHLDDLRVEHLMADHRRTLLARYSPDEQWFAYVGVEQEGRQVFVQRSDGSGPAIQLTSEGGNRPTWSADGRTLFYLDSDAGKLKAISLDLDRPSPQVAPAEEVMDLEVDTVIGTVVTDTEGVRVLVGQSQSDEQERHAIVVTNFRTELEQLLD
jgi:Tol biopolymer transport system component